MSAQHHSIVTAVFVALFLGAPLSAISLQGALQQAEARAASVADRARAGQAIRTAAQFVVGAQSEAALVARATLESELVAARAPELANALRATATEVAETTVAYRELWVTVDEGQGWQEFADVYGLSGTRLAALNPEVDVNSLDPGTRLLVYRYQPRLPSMSRGVASRGRLVNGMPMPEGEHWLVRNATRSWGTDETVSHLIRGLSSTAEALPGGGRPLIADISRRRGGRFRPHRSHTSGRDVDVTYYRSDIVSTSLFTRTRRHTLDHARQWYLFKYWIERDLVTYIFIDNRLQRSLYDFAASQGESRELLALAFGEPRGRGILRYSPGHDDHFHVRFVCTSADLTCRH
jgi:hypothetical protein